VDAVSDRQLNDPRLQQAGFAQCDREFPAMTNSISAHVRLPDAIPPEVASWLSQAAAALIDSFEADLQALILFGSAAEGRLRSSSDVNLLVVLRAFDAARAKRAQPVLRAAASAIQLHPMFLLRAELTLAIDSFAVKFEGIAQRGFVMYGEDALGAISIPRTALLHRLRQVLLNLTLRLRAAYTVGSVPEERLALIIAEAAAPLRNSAHTILELRGTPQTSPKAALEVLAAELGDHWADDLKVLSKVREDLLLPAGAAEPLVLRLAALAQALQQHAAALPP
jgi:hypothetical protein